MLKSCALLLLVIVGITEAGEIIFPGQLNHAEGDPCTTNTGGSGTCSRSCGHSSSPGEPRKCGIKDSRFLVCCDATSDTGHQPFTDTTPPRVGFECGKTKRSEFFLDLYQNEGGVLRSDNETLTFDDQEQLPHPGRPAGFPPGAIEAESKRVHELLPEGAYAAIGGVNASKNAWPWMALLGTLDDSGITWLCGGALINEQWVLTAYHCFTRYKIDVVRLGEHNYNDDFDYANHEDFAVAETELYPDYHHPEAYHDLALIRLAPRVALKEHISPVCLPWGRDSDKDITGQKATLTGWGDTEFRGYPSSILQEVNVTVFPSSRCDQGYSSLIHYPSTWPRGIGQDILCAGDPAGGRDACQGDSGGPLVSQNARGRFVLAGIVSKGYGCGHKDYPGLYANLRHTPYLAWIKKVAFGTQ